MKGKFSGSGFRRVRYILTVARLRQLFSFIGVPLLAMLVSCSESNEIDSAVQEADLIITGGKIYSLNWAKPNLEGKTSDAAPYDGLGWHADAEALAIIDGKIAAIGASMEIDKMRGEQTRVIDVMGATILPGLVDSHAHIPELGATLSRVNLIGIATEEEAVALIVEQAKNVPEGEWIVGQGWDEGAWANNYPDMNLLTSLVPRHPVLMRSLHGFGAWGNKMAFERVGITRDTPTPGGGEILYFDNGDPSGVLINNASSLLEEAVPAPSKKELKRQIVAGLAQMAKDGYVTVHDAGVSSESMAAMQELEDENALPVRVYAMLSARDAVLSEEWIKRGPDTDNGTMFVTRSVKAYYDGALGSRGARLFADYSDMPGHRGVSGNEYGFDQDLVEALMASGFQVGVHAIGDAGNKETLDFYEGVFERHPDAQLNRHRIEHAQIISSADMGRFFSMKIIASMEPPHAVEDMPWAERRVGSERIKGAYAWQTLRRSGATVIFNADNPGSDHSIFYGLHSAITRQDKSSLPIGGWYPDEAFTIEEAIRAYTTVAAYAGFRERETGILEVGRWADISIMDIDPFALAQSDPAQILEGRIVLTVVAGKVVYRAQP